MLRELLGCGYRVVAPVRSLPTNSERALSQPAHSCDESNPPGGGVADAQGPSKEDAGGSTHEGRNAGIEQSGQSDPRATYVLAEHLTSQCLHDLIGDTKIHAVISCIASRRGGLRDSEIVDYGINRELLNWATQANVHQFTLLSAICVQKPRLAFQRAKLRFEQELQASGLAHAIVRPTAFFKSLSGQINRVQNGKPFLVFGSGELTRCKPISEGDLARYLRLTIEDDELRGVLPIGGPGPAITPLEQGRMLAEAAGVPFRSRSAPPSLLRWVAAALSLGGKVIPALNDRAEFARIGHYYATESMLLWDTTKKAYDPDATPSFGGETLYQSYVDQIAGVSDQSLGEQAVFK